jgi:hypothetical protein
MTAARHGLVGLLALVATTPAAARTITITDQDCERMAVLNSAAPEVGWTAHEVHPGVYTTKYHLYLKPETTFLLAFPLDSIPKGQRITQAELVVPVHYVDRERKLTMRRVLADWGAGVNHQYRRQRPKKAEWAKPGAAGAADCAAKPSAVVKVEAAGDKTVNVTEDVELWYSGAAANNGWAFRFEDQAGYFYLLSPLSTYPAGAGSWKLRITYEPE